MLKKLNIFEKIQNFSNNILIEYQAYEYWTLNHRNCFLRHKLSKNSPEQLLKVLENLV